MKSMRIFLAFAAAFFLTVLTAHAQSDNAGDPAIPDRSYQLLREDENWTFLRNRALRQDFWDPIKYIPMRNRTDDWYLTIGGEAREGLGADRQRQLGTAALHERVSERTIHAFV